MSVSVASDRRRLAGACHAGVAARRSTLRTAPRRCFFELTERGARTIENGSTSDFREDELLNAIRAGHSEPDRPVVRFGLYLKIEERAASALVSNPLRDFHQRYLLRGQSE